jgi:hypothetical protein
VRHRRVPVRRPDLISYDILVSPIGSVFRLCSMNDDTVNVAHGRLDIEYTCVTRLVPWLASEVAGVSDRGYDHGRTSGDLKFQTVHKSHQRCN